MMMWEHHLPVQMKLERILHKKDYKLWVTMRMILKVIMLVGTAPNSALKRLVRSFRMNRLTGYIFTSTGATETCGTVSHAWGTMRGKLEQLHILGTLAGMMCYRFISCGLAREESLQERRRWSFNFGETTSGMMPESPYFWIWSSMSLSPSGMDLLFPGMLSKYHRGLQDNSFWMKHESLDNATSGRTDAWWSIILHYYLYRMSRRATSSTVATMWLLRYPLLKSV